MGDRIELQLLGGFRLWLEGRPVTLPRSVERLVIFLAFQAGPVGRPYAAGSLWPEVTDGRAGANLRSALWRLHDAGEVVLHHGATHISLACDAAVDLQRARHRGQAVLRAPAEELPDSFEASLFSRELLPGWYEDWIAAEREVFQEFGLQVLDAAAVRLCQQGRSGEAVLAASMASSVDPLREGPRRLLIRAHLEQGNVASAVRVYRDYARILEAELGLAPSVQMESLVRDLPGPHPADRRLEAVGA